MDALGLLKEDHDKVTKMLEELESTTERGVKTREELSPVPGARQVPADRWNGSAVRVI
jgi:hypothetical protein